MSKKKKHVKAPLTYDPGKGRPKEYLAYLNWQEMQALKRLNGEGPYPGPKGIPSFVLGGATTSGTAANRAMSSASQSTKTSTASKATPSGTKTTSGTATRAPAASAAAAKASASKASSAASNPGSRPSQGGTQGSVSSSAAKSSTTAAAAQAKTDAAAKQTTTTRDTNKAVSSPAVKNDISKAVSSGTKLSDITGTNTPGGSIKGALKAVQETAAQAAARRVGPFAPTPNQYKTPQAMERAMLQDLKTNKIDPAGRGKVISSIERLGEMGRVIQGEAAFESPFGQAAVGNTMFNRIDAYNEAGERLAYKGGDDFDSLMRQYDANGIRVPGTITGSYIAAVPGTPEYRKGIIALNQALGPNSYFNENASPALKRSTNYYNPNTPAGKPDWAQKSDVKVGNHYFGTAENIGKTVATARRNADANINPAGFDKRIDVASRTPDTRLGLLDSSALNSLQKSPVMSTADVARAAAYMTDPTARPYDVRTSPSVDQIRTSAPVERTSVPGLISYPNLDRPAAPTQDGVPQTGDLRQGPPVVTDPRVSITSSGYPAAPKTKEFYDRVTPTGFVGRNAALNAAIAEDMVRKINAGTIAAESPSYGPEGAAGERMLYRPSAETQAAMQQVFNQPRGMSFTPGLPAAMPVSPPKPTPRPERFEVAGMSFTPGLPVATPPSPPKPTPRPERFEVAGMSFTPGLPPQPTYSPVPSPISTGMLPPGANVPPAFRSATAGISDIPGMARAPAPPTMRGATAAIASSFGPEVQFFNDLQRGIDRTNANIAPRQEAGIKALADQIESTFTLGPSTKEVLSNPLIKDAVGWMNVETPFGVGQETARQAATNRVRKEVNKIATDLYKQYAPEVTKMAQEKIQAGAAGFVKMANMGIKAGMNFEGSLEGAKTVNEAEGEKINASNTERYSLADLAGLSSQPTPITAPQYRPYDIRGTEVRPVVQNIPEYRSPTTVPPPVDSLDAANEFANISMAGGLGMVPYNKPGSKKLGVSAEQSIDKRERDIQKYYDGNLKMTTSQEKTVDEYLDRADKAMKVTGALTRIPVGLGSKAYKKSVKEKINSYIDATPEEKLAMEKANPEVIRWATIIGEQTISPYQDYVNWATSRGLRGPTEISRDGGIYNIVQGDSDTGGGSDEEGYDEGTPSASSSSGPRPEIYYMWDLGVNIPSPGDPNYTMYMTYLAERNAAQAAMYT